MLNHCLLQPILWLAPIWSSALNLFLACFIRIGLCPNPHHSHTHWYTLLQHNFNARIKAFSPSTTVFGFGQLGNIWVFLWEGLIGIFHWFGLLRRGFWLDSSTIFIECIIFTNFTFLLMNHYYTKIIQNVDFCEMFTCFTYANNKSWTHKIFILLFA